MYKEMFNYNLFTIKVIKYDRMVDGPHYIVCFYENKDNVLIKADPYYHEITKNLNWSYYFAENADSYAPYYGYNTYYITLGEVEEIKRGLEKFKN